MEIWKDIAGYEGLYQVSNLGNVKSLPKIKINGKSSSYMTKEKILKKSRTSTGYWKIDLKVNGERKSFKVHRLVAFAFIPVIQGKNQVNHIDGNPLNNEVGNLEWCDQSENMIHAYETGLKPTNLRLKKDEIINSYNNGMSVRNLCKKYNVGYKSVKEMLDNNGVHIRSLGESKDVYNIDKVELAKMFEMDMRNVDVARHFNTNRGLIGTYKHKWKRGILL